MNYRIFIHGGKGGEYASSNFPSTATAAWQALLNDHGVHTFSIRWEDNGRFGTITQEQAEALVPSVLALTKEPDHTASLYFLGYLLGKKLD